MGSKKTAQAEAPSPTSTAKKTLAARQATDPAAQQLAFSLQQGPGGMQDYTQLGYNVRQNVFGEEDAVKQALLQNLLSSYQSPYGIPEQMQAGVNQVRNNAQDKLMAAMRDRANLGGGLYGGRSAQSEAQSVSDLQAGFAEQDYNQMNQNRQIQYMATLNALAQLYPQLGISSTPFETAAPSGSNVYSTQAQINQSNASLQAQAKLARDAQIMELAKMGGAALAMPFAAASPASLGSTASFGNAAGQGYGATAYTAPTAKQLAFLG